MNKAKYISANHQERTLLFSSLGFCINLIYAVGNGIIGIMTKSWWSLTMAAYYIVLSTMRISVILYAQKNKHNTTENELFIKHFCGFMFIVLDVVLAGTSVLTIKQNIGTAYHEIIMIAIATYTFTKITFAVINLCKSKRYNSPIITTLRNISFADAFVSIFSLQRSMLVSFEGMTQGEIRLFNSLTGTGVCIIILILGINLIRKVKSDEEIHAG